MTPILIQVDPASLRPNPWNSNIVSPENEAKLDASMKELGIFKPVLVREIASYTTKGFAYEIIGGEHRAQSAVRLGIPEIAAYNLGPLGDEQAKKIGLADNARYGVDDVLSLAAIIDSLGEHNLSAILPYSDGELNAFSSAVSISLDELELDKENDEPAGEAAKKAPKTHSVMRFKISLGDAERVASILHTVQQKHGYTKADDLTNAGDALVHLILGEPETADGEA